MKLRASALLLLLGMGIVFGGACLPLASQEYKQNSNAKASGLEKVDPKSAAPPAYRQPLEQEKAPKRMAWTKALQPRYEINFGREYPAQGLVYFNELEAWGRNHNLLLLPDLALRGLQDFEAARIPDTGLTFELDAPVFSRVYLYLDLAAYRPLGEAGEASLHKAPLSYLEVLVNGHSLKTVYYKTRGTQPGTLIPSPLVVPVELEHIPYGKLQVLLRPGPQKNNFAIWDAFVSSYPL